MGKRSISDSFLKMFKEGGKFHPIVELVKIDPYLDLELRGDSVKIYYRGGKILSVNEKGYALETLDQNYYLADCGILCPQPSMDNIHDYFAKAKYVVDFHEANAKQELGEKEFQQRIVFENNLSVNADNTDFFIADLEWADSAELGGRADIVAFQWNHMEHKKREIQMVLIEVKQGEHAIKTVPSQKDDKDSAGLKKHIDDFMRFKQNADYVKSVQNDMFKVLIQKRDIGLIKGLDLLDKDRNNKKKYVSIIEDPDFLIALCNYHHYSDILAIESEQLPDDCKFITSSFMGCGLYKDFIRTKVQMQQEFPTVFFKKRK